MKRNRGRRLMGEINVVPYIDVMLVLLVIFMITAPLMSTSLKLDLPRSDAATATETPLFLAVAITPEGALFLGDEKLAIGGNRAGGGPEGALFDGETGAREFVEQMLQPVQTPRFHPRPPHFSMPSSSTSNTRVAFGGITRPAPRAP